MLHGDTLAGMAVLMLSELADPSAAGVCILVVKYY